MVPGQYSSLSSVSMIEECRSFLCSREDHILQCVVSNNGVGLSPCLLIHARGLFLFFEDQGSMYWDCQFDITDTDVL
jgi:hypothetical protein